MNRSPRALRTRARRDRGGAALLLMLVLLIAAASVGSLAIRGAVSDLSIAGAQRRGKTGFYCAEGGINSARAYFAANGSTWGAMFDTAQTPPVGYPVRGDLDGDGVNDYEVTLNDNVDEFPVANPLSDNDLTAVMTARCISPTLASRPIAQIVTQNTRGTNYRSQAGHGSNHSGNVN